MTKGPLTAEPRTANREPRTLVQAFTLLETLLAVSLTAAIGLAAFALTTMQARTGAAARAQEEALALITETARLIDDDLLLAARQPGQDGFQILDDGGLRLVTGCRLPGDRADMHEVVWRLDAADGALLRISRPLHGGETATRRIGRGWNAFAISSEQDTAWVELRPATATAAWRIPLWSDPP